MRSSNKEPRFIAVRTLDGGWCQLDTSQCVSVEGMIDQKYDSRSYLHKTKHTRWFRETVSRQRDNGVAFEVTIDGALDWLVEQFGENFPPKLRCLEDLSDITNKPTASSKAASLVFKCAKCRAIRIKKHEKIMSIRSDKAFVICKCLRESEVPLSAKEIAYKAKLPSDSHLRTKLAELVATELVVKLTYRVGYVLAEKLLS